MATIEIWRKIPGKSFGNSMLKSSNKGHRKEMKGRCFSQLHWIKLENGVQPQSVSSCRIFGAVEDWIPSSGRIWIRNSHQTSCNNLIFTIFFGWHLHSSSLVYHKFKPTHNPIFFPRLNFPFTSVQEVNCHQPKASTLFVLRGGWPPTSVHIADLKRRDFWEDHPTNRNWQIPRLLE